MLFVGKQKAKDSLLFFAVCEPEDAQTSHQILLK
jgi:hypothetical protein